MDDFDEPAPVSNVDTEIKELLGLFDLPAFVRRGQDLEHALARLHERCRREREGMLEMVRVRLRQWAGTVTGPEAWRESFASPIDGLWPSCGAEPPAWSDRPPLPRRRRSIARDLSASVARFNRRWYRFLDDLNVEPVNRQIDDYNRYYLLEKECSMGSARLAAQHFRTVARLTPESLLEVYPLLTAPELS